MRDVARLKTRAIDVQFPVPVVQVFFGVLQHGLRLQNLNECAAKVEKERALLVAIRGFGDGSELLRLIETQFPLIRALCGS